MEVEVSKLEGVAKKDSKADDQKLYGRLKQQRGIRLVTPMQDVVKEIFELDNCRMRGNANNRRLFAAMGVPYK